MSVRGCREVGFNNARDIPLFASGMVMGVEPIALAIGSEGGLFLQEQRRKEYRAVDL